MEVKRQVALDWEWMDSSLMEEERLLLAMVCHELMVVLFLEEEMAMLCLELVVLLLLEKIEQMLMLLMLLEEIVPMVWLESWVMEDLC